MEANETLSEIDTHKHEILKIQIILEGKKTPYYLDGPRLSDGEWMSFIELFDSMCEYAEIDKKIGNGNPFPFAGIDGLRIELNLDDWVRHSRTFPINDEFTEGTPSFRKDGFYFKIAVQRLMRTLVIYKSNDGITEEFPLLKHYMVDSKTNEVVVYATTKALKFYWCFIRPNARETQKITSQLKNRNSKTK